MRAEIRLRLLAFLAVFLVAGVLLAPATGQAQGARPQLFQPGFRTIGIWNPSTGMRMDVAVWYPSLRPPKAMRIDGWSIHVAKNGREAPGQYPVILLSHGAGGSRLTVHDLAEDLACQGFLVIAPTHPGDNVDDTTDIYSTRLFQERPRHLLLALEAALATPEISPLMDESRIGLLGVGSGAATVLQLAGATPDISLLGAFCAREQSADPMCTNWALAHHAAMENDYAAVIKTQGTSAFTPNLGFFVAPAEPVKTTTDSDTPPGSDKDEETNMTSPIPAPVRALPAPAVTRRPAAHRQIIAVGLMTPGLIGLFPEASLRAVTAPVSIMDVADDALYPPANNTKPLEQNLPARAAVRTLKDIGHYTLQAPCPPVSADSVDAQCDGRNEKENEAAAQRNTFFVRFFRRELGSPLPPLPVPPPEAPKRQPATRVARPVGLNATLPAAATNSTALRQGNGTRQGNETARPERPAGRRIGNGRR